MTTAALPDTSQPYLSPVEHPRGLMLKLVYAMTRKRFGKVLTPMKVFASRLPLAFGAFYGKIGQLDKKLELPEELVMLVRIQVARTNVCEFCIDIARAFAVEKSMSQAKLDALAEYATSPLFTELERAALDFATKLTREKKMDPQTFGRLASCFSERAICEIVWLIASEHLYNVANIGLNIHSDMLCKPARTA
jgi:AhpD family alkylhydroperoxidase